MDGEASVCRKRTPKSASASPQSGTKRIPLTAKKKSAPEVAPEAAPPAEAENNPAAAAEAPVSSSPARKWNAKVRTAFLEALAELGQVRAAARAAGVSPQLVYRERQKNPDFAKEWQEAMDRALDALEETLLDRAMNGVEKQVYYGGKSCGSVRQYSDALAMFLLRARRPETYGRAAIADVQAPPGNTSGQGDPVALIAARLRKLAGGEAGKE